MPKFQFVGPDPIEHFDLGDVSPGDVRELDACPAGPWRAVKRRPSPTPEPSSDPTSDSPEED